MQSPFCSRDLALIEADLSNKSINFEFTFPKTYSFVNFTKVFDLLTSGEAIHINFKEKYIPSNEIKLKTKLINILDGAIQAITKTHQLANPAIATTDYLPANEITAFLIHFITINNSIANYHLNYTNHHLIAILVKK